MGLVVTDGTAPVMRNVAGGQVFGKTGTAEYGNADPPQTRAWFAGFQGSVAFAVLVEEGRSGGSVAAPIAKSFLENLR
jgi:cell division protein FtsI/penicillin-binding protein 2